MPMPPRRATNERETEVEVSPIQSARLRFPECKTKGVTHHRRGSGGAGRAPTRAESAALGGGNPCWFCTDSSLARSLLAQFSQSIKFEGIDVEITRCVACMMSVTSRSVGRWDGLGRDQRKMTSRGKKRSSVPSPLSSHFIFVAAPYAVAEE